MSATSGVRIREVPASLAGTLPAAGGRDCSRHGIAIVAAGCCSVLVTLASWALFPVRDALQENSDMIGFYEPVARNLAAGRGLMRHDGSPALRYPPGFPLVLAAVYSTARFLHSGESLPLHILAAGSMAVSSMLLYGLAASVWGWRRASLPAALWITYPFALWFTQQPTSESVFIPLLFAAAAMLCSATARRGSPLWFLTIGVVAGAAILVRPIGLAMLPGLIAGSAVVAGGSWRLRALSVSAVVVGVCLLVGPWEVWCYRQVGQVVVISTGGPPTIRDGLTFAAISKEYRETVALPQSARLASEAFSKRLPEMKSLAEIRRVFLDELRRMPAPVAALMAAKVARSWYGTDSGRYERIIAGAQACYFALIAAGLFGCRKAAREGRIRVGVVVSMAVGFWLMTTVNLSILRYMVPAMGLLFLAAPGILEGGAHTKMCGVRSAEGAQ